MLGTSENSGSEWLSSTSRVHFDPRLFSTPRGECAPGINVTRYEQVDMSLTQTGGGSKSHGEKYTESDIEKRQRVLEEAFGSLQGMVDGLGVDFGCLKSEVDSIRTGIGSLETSMTEQVRGVSSQIREMFQMSGLLSVSRSPEIQGNAASFGTSQSQIPSSQGGPWVPGQAVQTKSVDRGNVTFFGGPGVC